MLTPVSAKTDGVHAEPVSGRLPVIHIGMPKTATKTLQWCIFAQHSEIFYLGRYDGQPFRSRYRAHGACRDDGVFRIMDQIAYRGIHNPDIPLCRKTLQDYLLLNNSRELLPVWSWESYCTDNRENRRLRAEALRGVFGEARILVTIRHPVHLLESAYLQQLKRDNIGARSRRGRPAFYQTIDDWVTRDVGGDISDHLDYPETIRIYADLFGVDNVRVLAFEQLLKDKAGFFANICKFMGIDLAEALQLLDSNTYNSRWTMTQLERLQSIRGSFFKSLVFQFADRRTRKDMLDLNRAGSPRIPGPGAKVEIAAELRERILDRTRKGNLWLDRTFDMGLAEMGYLGR